MREVIDAELVQDEHLWLKCIEMFIIFFKKMTDRFTR